MPEVDFGFGAGLFNELKVALKNFWLTVWSLAVLFAFELEPLMLLVFELLLSFDILDMRAFGIATRLAFGDQLNLLYFKFKPLLRRAGNDEIFAICRKSFWNLSLLLFSLLAVVLMLLLGHY